jgi:hypothetical protein
MRVLFLFLFLLPYWNLNAQTQTSSDAKGQGQVVTVESKERIQTTQPYDCDLGKIKGLRFASVENPKYYEPMEKVLPEYPKFLQEKGVAGKVVVNIWFYDGKVVLACIHSGPKELRPLAEKAVKQWKFKPTVLLSEKICLATSITFDFVP